MGLYRNRNQKVMSSDWSGMWSQKVIGPSVFCMCDCDESKQLPVQIKVMLNVVGLSVCYFHAVSGHPSTCLTLQDALFSMNFFIAPLYH